METGRAEVSIQSISRPQEMAARAKAEHVTALYEAVLYCEAKVVQRLLRPRHAMHAGGFLYRYYREYDHAAW